MTRTEHFAAEKHLLSQLKDAGFAPAVFYDIGASDGFWSEIIAGVFPGAQYHLFEPLAGRVDAYRTDLQSRLLRLPNLSLHAVALGDFNGAATMFVAKDTYGSSLLDRGDVPEVVDRIQVPQRRLDDYAAEMQLPAPDVIKIDCQGAEDVILRGGVKALGKAQVVLLETWLSRRYGPKTPLLCDIIDLLQSFSFSPVEIGERFYDDEHRLYSMDVFFAAESLLKGIQFPEETPCLSGSRPVVASPGLCGAGLQQAELRPAASAPQAASQTGGSVNGASLAELTRRLLALVEGPAGGVSASMVQDRSRSSGVVLRDADAIVTHIEVNTMHGVGVMTRRLFLGQSNILSVRSANRFGGQQEFGDLALCISHENKSRDEVFCKVLEAVGQSTVGRVYCVPYFPDDVLNALALKEIFGVPLCLYLVDDQNVCARGIPDGLMRELLAKTTLRLMGSPELCQVYELKYGYKSWYLPPVVDGCLILSQLNVPPAGAQTDRGVIIGNIWGRQWLRLLRETVRNSGVTLDWYCNGGFRDISCQKEELVRDSIVPNDPPADEDLVRALRRAWFAVLPSGTLAGDDDRRFITQLSLPSRLVYLMATSQAPILVLGSPRSAAANFVRQFGVGMVADYNRRSFVEAVKALTERDTNLAMRHNALAAAARFSDAGVTEWIWRSLARGEPIDRRYEDLMPTDKPDLSHLLDSKVRPAPHASSHAVG